MADIQVINHGELQWDAKANHNFSELNQALEKVGEVTDQLHWTKPTDEGIVLTNGFTGWVNYSYLQLGDSKLVFFEGALKGNLKAKQYTDVLTLPDNIRPTNKIYQCRRWNTIADLADNKLGAFNDSDTDDINPSSSNLIFHFMYKI